MEYKTKKVKIGSLLLDPRNSRIPAARRSEDQRALLHELVEEENVMPLANLIAKNGLFPNERLIVVTAHGTFFHVLEGNRRLAAIKLLHNPGLAQKKGQEAQLRKLASTADLVALGKIDVLQVENRIAAAPMLASMHIGDSKSRWKSVQQAQFYRELRDEGLSAAEIADHVGTTLSAVLGSLRAEQVYRYGLSLEYDDEETRRKIGDPRRFPLTTLERFLESSTGQARMGITRANDTFKGLVHRDYFNAVLKEVMTSVATKPGLTREVNDEDGMAAFFDHLEEKLPKTKKRGSFTLDTLLGDSDEGEDDTGEPQPKPKPRGPRRSQSVVPTGFRCATTTRKVKSIFEELRKLKVATHPNSSGVMLRVLLDVGLWDYLERRKLVTEILNHFDPDRKRRKRREEWTPNLRDLISYAVGKKVLEGVTAREYRSVRRLAARDNESVATIDGLNEYTHDLRLQPTEAELRTVWERAEPMLRVILNFED